jgi:putative methyltransferase (TIGR04325 family)
MNRLKSIAQNWLPPILLHKLRQLRQSDSICFEGNFSTWEEAAALCDGYDSELILAKVLEATLKVKNGEAAYERDSVLFDEIDYSWPVTAALLWAAAKNGGKLDVLDFGGALGSSYFQNRSFLVGLQAVRWSIIEQSHYVEAGRKYIEDGPLKFYDTIDQCLLEGRPNLVLFSSVLQYLPSPESAIDMCSKLGARLIVFDRTIVNNTKYNSIHIQITPSSIYEASYPCRSFSEEKLLNQLPTSYKLNSKFDSLNFPALTRINSAFKGYIFIKINNEKVS